MGPIPLRALRRAATVAVVATILLPGCAAAPPAVSSPAPPAVSSPTPPAVSSPAPPAVSSPTPPAVSSPTPPAVRLAVAASAAVARPAGTAGATLTAVITGTTVVDETWSGWTDGAWSHRSSVVLDGVSTTAAEVVAVDGRLHLRVDGASWRTAPGVGAAPDAVRDPGEVLALLRRATDVTEGPAADVLVAVVPMVATTGGEGEVARFEVRLTDREPGTEAVAEVRGTIPPLQTGGVAVAVDAWWSAERPPPIVAPTG